MEQRHQDQDLANFKNKLLSMGGEAENSVRLAIKAFDRRDDDLANEAEAADSRIDQFEIDVDEEGVLLLSRAPLARDLRLIIAGMKISTELERIGDEATTISRQVRILNREPEVRPGTDFQHMAGLAASMLHDALNCFVNIDSTQARTIVPRDKEIDKMHKAARKEIEQLLSSRPETAAVALSLLTISKSLERIGDHAKNIAEEVVYLGEALDIRHRAAEAS